MPGPGQNWLKLTPYGVGSPGSPVQGALPGQVGGAQAMVMRDPLDAERAMIGDRVPAAEYPSGYLGTLQSRREDRLLSDLKDTLNSRSANRGVHVGEKIDPMDYFWPSQCSDQAGLVRQSQAVPQPDGTMASPRNAPLMTMLEQMQADGSRLPTGPNGRVQVPYVQDAEANRDALAALLPDWSLR